MANAGTALYPPYYLSFCLTSHFYLTSLQLKIYFIWKGEFGLEG